MLVRGYMYIHVCMCVNVYVYESASMYVCEYVQV